MRLKRGKLYELDGRPWRCVLVNDSRAKLVPAWKERRTFTEESGNERSFWYTPDALDVSPNSELREWSEEASMLERRRRELADSFEP